MPGYNEIAEVSSDQTFSIAIAIGFFVMMSIIMGFFLSIGKKFLMGFLKEMGDLVNELKKTNLEHQTIKDNQSTLISYEANETAQYVKLDNDIHEVDKKIEKVDKKIGKVNIIVNRIKEKVYET